MSARICGVCRATLGNDHLQLCTIGKGKVIDAQCITVSHESAILWVFYCLHILHARGLIQSSDPMAPAQYSMTPKGVLMATEYFTKNPAPGREAIIASAQWILASKIRTPAAQIAPLITLILDCKGPLDDAQPQSIREH